LHNASSFVGRDRQKEEVFLALFPVVNRWCTMLLTIAGGNVWAGIAWPEKDLYPVTTAPARKQGRSRERDAVSFLRSRIAGAAYGKHHEETFAATTTKWP
jgi:hypothetical protein